MNYLAHLYLSGNNHQVLIGNFMADSIKGNSYNNYPEDQKKGILLHRFIDSYTDQHPLVTELKRLCHHKLHHYSGIAIDIILDHLLASNWSIYSDKSLLEFTENSYQILNLNFDELTPQVQNFLPIMVKHNWLYNYRTIKGIREILLQMNHRIKHRVDLSSSVNIMLENKLLFEKNFQLFFNDLILNCQLFLNEYHTDRHH